MSALFDVRVINKDEKKSTVDLHLTIINPDQKTFYNTKSFALLLLIDPFLGSGSKNPALFKEVPLDDILNFNLDIIKKKESKVIKKVELHDVKNFPLPDLSSYTDDQVRAFWSDKKKLPRAELTITVKDPAFIVHLKKGQSWESGAFNVI
ncbi:MAG: hypothetical protein HOP10_04225 [Chitinophagaceae bacterium]|nr:hypothetical protein [Chitinophagaceae bacterium]